MTFNEWTPYQYNANTDLDWEINRYLKNNETFITSKEKKYEINKKERLNLEEILNVNKNKLNEIAVKTSSKNLLKLKNEIIVSSATLKVRNYIDEILKLQNNEPSLINKTENLQVPNKSIEKNKNLSIVQYFNKSSKWRKLKLLIEKYSSISIERMNEYVVNASNDFDVPIKYIMSVIIWESDVSKLKNPFKVNDKGIWQFLSKSFKWLYSKVIWTWSNKKWNRRTSQWDVLYYFTRTKNNKYSLNLKNIWINKLSDRHDPEKSILAIWAYLKYISLVNNKMNFTNSVAKYNIWPFWTIWNTKHLNNNPVIKEEFVKIYWKNAKVTESRVYAAAKQYYIKYV